MLRILDPLDLEIIARAFDDVWHAIRGQASSVDLETDKELGAALRDELVELARFSDLSDPEALREIPRGA
jgi:hypothetical protein